MTPALRSLRALAAVIVIPVGLAGCTTIPAPGEATRVGNPAACANRTLKPGVLTVATYAPAYAPWFVGDDPDNGRGFEAGLAYRIAQRMGIKPERVLWKRQPFTEIVTPGQRGFDLALAEVSATAHRRDHIDFSSSYATVQQAVVTYRDSPLKQVSTLAQLRSARLGASADTTSHSAAAEVIKPVTPVTSFPSIEAAGKALADHQVDGVVADLPTAHYLATSVLQDGRLIGRLPGAEEPIAAVLPKKSALTQCINDAIASLRSSGALDHLARQWLPEDSDTHVLR